MNGHPIHFWNTIHLIYREYNTNEGSKALCPVESMMEKSEKGKILLWQETEAYGQCTGNGGGGGR